MTIETTFDRFMTHMPEGGDITLHVLKAHLLVEELLWQVVRRRIERPEFVEGAELEHLQLMRLAQSSVDQFSEDVSEAVWLWPTLEKLNTLRNRFAHDLEPAGVDDRIADIISRCPRKLDSDQLWHRFGFAVWVICQQLHDLIEPITESDLEHDPR